MEQISFFTKKLSFFVAVGAIFFTAPFLRQIKRVFLDKCPEAKRREKPGT